jgi:hypothetical protein
VADLDPHRAMATMVGEGRGYEAVDRDCRGGGGPGVCIREM